MHTLLAHEILGHEVFELRDVDKPVARLDALRVVVLSRLAHRVAVDAPVPGRAPVDK